MTGVQTCALPILKGMGAIGLVTYIRTASTRISAEALQEAIDYIKGKYGEKYVPSEKRIFKNKTASQDAHECIRPAQVTMTPDSIKDSLTKEQYKLYKLIWSRFVSSQMSSAEYDTINTDITSGDYTFRANGQILKFQGFIVLYQEGKDEEGEEGENNVPDLVEGEELKQNKIDQIGRAHV